MNDFAHILWSGQNLSNEKMNKTVYPGWILTPCFNEKINSGKSHLQDLAQWWRTSQGVYIPKISQFYWGLFEKTRFLCFYIIKSSKKQAKMPLNLTSEGQKYPPEVRVQHETCSTICGTHVQAILDQKNLTGSAGGAREGQNMAHLGHFNGKCAKMHYPANGSFPSRSCRLNAGCSPPSSPPVANSSF